MSRDILIVDDIRSTLENLGNEVRLNLAIEPFLADDPYQAFDILRYYPIKVLVTDQEMPGMTGTELVRKVKDDLGLKIPCIMLTGFADKVSASDVVNLGFFRFIDKDNARAELTQSIRQALRHYEMSALHESLIEVNKPLISKKSFLKFKNQVSLKLLRVSSIVNPFIREKDWHTELIAQRNIHGVHRVSVRHKANLSIEYGVNSEILLSVGLNLKKLFGGLESILENKISLEAKIKNEYEIEIQAENTLEVKEITDEPTNEGMILQSREYQSAPVYTRINCVFQIECSCCRIPRTFDISLDVPTNTIALRQVEHFDKGPSKKIYTGFFTGTII
ncbi:MAG: response regulator receiver [Candidatus Methanoperedens nitroreducens]|uniref:Response regulator receiver n=1 Tax=Candidatus Methanoperedens nitratireducens TaxID=1392998 RepID=A0A0P8CC85_9EURY|nr:response regulator [Candidatus Methanoperedens sp. BLZ2]KAB2944358.1 MAG: response regulator [Candidatus Methanoperedens sp.]KPQ44539.1 MAG: response regulator receiver [Candidatus Methanoperedens sp. BLZ1]MBZ0175329.1 response regulator [Candidatus Methanoperedens nitroreducens]MCX9079472.1 response regulator [Candidatus Methanoperedens sp.]MCX9086147.1 response regulator [Candidatus Methanoperedens sp.]